MTDPGAGLLDGYGDPLNPVPQELFSGMPAVITPQPFTIADKQWKNSLDKLKDDVMDKENQWEGKMTTIFGEMDEFTDSWRVISRKMSNKPKGVFNSRSGETHRAAETLGTL